MRYYAIKFTIICVIVFIIQNIYPQITEMFLLASKDVMYRPWILITSIFLHGSFLHLFYNMFALVLFGLILESIIGTKKFIYIFFLTGLIASIASMFFYDASLGASGAIFGIMGTLAVLRPKMAVWVYGVPMPMFVAAIFWIILNFGGIFFPSNIAYASHLGGMISGIIIGFFLRTKFSEKEEKKENVVPEYVVEQWEEQYM